MDFQLNCNVSLKTTDELKKALESLIVLIKFPCANSLLGKDKEIIVNVSEKIKEIGVSPDTTTIKRN